MHVLVADCRLADRVCRSWVPSLNTLAPGKVYSPRCVSLWSDRKGCGCSHAVLEVFLRDDARPKWILTMPLSHHGTKPSMVASMSIQAQAPLAAMCARRVHFGW